MRLITGFDTETTGLLEPEHRIIEWALLLYDLDTRRMVGSFVRRYNPGRPIDAKAQAVHGIAYEQVAHLPKLADCPNDIAMIQEIFRKSLAVVAHNGHAFDMPFARQELQGVGADLPAVYGIDTMVDGRWATPDGKSPNLGELCFACREPYDPDQAHAAEYDVTKMMNCFFHGLQRGFYSLPPGISINP